MEDHKNKNAKLVHTITEFAHMRFSPQRIYAPQSGKAKGQLVQKIKKMWTPNLSQEESLTLDDSSDQADTIDQILPQLKFARKLTAEHILIGNQNQLDLISLHFSSHTFLDTEHLWSINIDSPIELISVDVKKAILILGSRCNKKISVYHYDSKKIHKMPTIIANISLDEEPFDIALLKDLLFIFFNQKAIIYGISSSYQVIQRQVLHYQFPEKVKYCLYRVPQPVDSNLNIFFEQPKPHSSVFVLWMIEIDYLGNVLKVKPAEKIYDIKNSLKKKIKLHSNYTKGTFLMSLGNQILIFKKGYVIDAANINVKIDHSHLKYIGQNRLVHYSDKRLELYNFILKTDVKPYKIQVNTFDSMEVYTPKNSILFDIIPVSGNNVLLILQGEPSLNKKTKGQLNYWLAVTQLIRMEKKIDLLFPRRKVDTIDRIQLESRIEMATKMGMSKKDIYLQLWNRCPKEERNFHLLISTCNYRSIEQEVATMLKSKSMPFTQLFNIERSAMEMLKGFLFSTNCNKDIFFGYISSRYLLKKLQYFRILTSMVEGEFPRSQDHHLMISIKKYYQIQEMHLINSLISLAQELCIEGKPVANELRLYLHTFRFQLRMNYIVVITKLIETLKSSFLKLIQEIPEILPYTLPQKYVSQEMNWLYQGIWMPINPTEMKQQICYENCATIDNRDIIKEGIKDLWFRRVDKTTHCFIKQSFSEIDEIYDSLKSEQTFYTVIELVLKEVDNPQDYRKIFAYMETKYQSNLTHLKNRINLYYLLYYYLKRRSILPINQDKKPFQFKQFLSLEDDALFHHLFKTEKQRKGLLLQQILPIFQEKSPEGGELFNEFLLNFFKSDLSEVSDIKYLLNRINNEKQQFHLKSQSMYTVIVEAMTRKLIVGTKQDIPLQQILIYIENIPIYQNEDSLMKLTTISAINQNARLLQQARINMTIQEIMEDPEKMMTKIIDSFILSYEICNETSSDKQFDISYTILAKLQHLHNEIVKAESTFYIFFIYLVKLAQHKALLPHVTKLIDNEYLAEEFGFDSSISQNLVVYLYKSKLSAEPEYLKNENYLRTLLYLLPEDNQIRQFIICEFQIARRLSSKKKMTGYAVEYPLSEKHVSLGMVQLQEILQNLNAEEIAEINIQELSALVHQMYNLNMKIVSAIAFIDDQEKSDLLSSVFYRHATSELTRKQIFEIFILRMLQLKMLEELIPIIDHYFEDPSQILESDIVFPMLYLLQMSQDLTSQSKELFFLASCYLFKSPVELFQIIKDYVQTPFNAKRRLQFLHDQVLICKQKSKGFKIENQVLNPQMIKIALKEGLDQNLFSVLIYSYKYICLSRNELSNFSYAFMYAIMINSPYLLAKYLLCSRKQSAVKNIRLFLTYLIKEASFDPLPVLELGHRIFFVVLYSLRDQMEMEEVVRRFTDFPLEEYLPSDFNPDFNKEIKYFKLLASSAKAFRAQKYRKAEKTQFLPAFIEGESGFRNRLSAPEKLVQNAPIQFSDIEIDESADEKKILLSERKPTNFIEKDQLRKAIKRQDLLKREHKIEYPQRKIVQKKKAFEEDFSLEEDSLKGSLNDEQKSEDEFHMIRVIPAIQDSSESEKKMPNQTFQVPHKQEEASVEQAVPLQEQKQRVFQKQYKHENHEEEVEELKPEAEDVKVLIKKSALSFRDESDTPNMDDFEEKQFQDAKNSSKEKLPHLQVHFEKSVSSREADFNSLQDYEQKYFKSDNLSQRPFDPQMERKIMAANERRTIPLEEDTKTNVSKIESMPHPYKRFQGMPKVEEIGRKLYQNNFISFEKNQKKRKYHIQALRDLEYSAHFVDFLKEVIKYIYKEASESSIEGIIGFFQLLTTKYNLHVDPQNFAIFKRGEVFYKNADPESNPREELPIQAIFLPKATPWDIYKYMEARIMNKLDDRKVYKIAKTMGMIFLSDEVEKEVIYNYFLILSQRELEDRTEKYEKEILTVVVQNVPLNVLSRQFSNYYLSANPLKRQWIMEQVTHRVKKQGSKDQKIELFSQVVEFDPSHQAYLQNLKRRRR